MILEKALINQSYLREGTSINTAYGVPWGKLYKFDIIKDIFFDTSLKRMEDNIFNHKIIKCNPNMVVKYIDEPLYIYRINHIIKYNAEYESDVKSWIKVIKARKELIQSHIGQDDEINKFFYKEVVQILVFVLNKKFFHKDNNNRLKSFSELNEILNDETIQIAMKLECEGTPNAVNLIIE